jgi:hypothetical protein
VTSPTFQHGNTAVFKIVAVDPDVAVDLADVDPIEYTLAATALSLPAPAKLR